MPLKTFRPITPANRYKQLPDFQEITKSKPEKSLCRPLKKSGGRNNQGRITCRHRGGGHKRKYRLIDFKRKRTGDAAEVQSIEYDPNRTARIALIQYKDGEKAYILAPRGLKVGDKVSSGEKAPVKPGCCFAALQNPDGNLHSQCGIDSRSRRSNRAECRTELYAFKPRRRLCIGQTAFGRDSQDQLQMCGDHRHHWQS